MRIPDFYVIILSRKNLFEVIGMIRRTTALLLCLLLCVFCLLPAAGSADDDAKIIRVGWYETPFNYSDSAGRRTGYAYEYQRKIAAYTGQCHSDKDDGKRTGTEIGSGLFFC